MTTRTTCAGDVAAAPVRPPVTVGFGSVPRPAVVRVTTTVSVPDGGAAD